MRPFGSLRRVCLILGVAVCVGGCGTREAERLQTLALSLSDRDSRWDESTRSALGLPSSVQTRDDAVVWLFEESEAKSNRYLGSYLWLGSYFLVSDCDRAIHYLRRHLELEPRSSEGKGLLDTAVEEGCAAARVSLDDDEADRNTP